MSDKYTGNLVEYILNRNAEQSSAFSSAAARLARTAYRGKHPTEFAALKCMDGRLHLATYLQIPQGIIQPFRNIGGRFDLGWPFFTESVKAWVNYCVKRGRRCVFLVSYHYSKGKRERGCAGWNYDTESAKADAFRLAKQIENVFGKSPTTVSSVVIGLETDHESLILHGHQGNTLDLSTLSSAELLPNNLQELYPDMDSELIKDFSSLLSGNIDHVKQIVESNRPPIDLEHREQILAVGRGFDWLHIPNKALMIGPYSHEWTDAVMTAGKIILSNLREGRVPKSEGVLLLISALSRDQEGSFGWNLAIEKVRYLERVCLGIVRDRVPELAENLTWLSGVTFADTRKFHVMNVSEK